MTRIRSRFLGLLTALVVWSAEIATGQVSPPLGPKDGAGLPTTDLARIAVGRPAPDFALESKDGGTVTLSSFRGRKDVVLVFYRGHW